MIRQKLRRVGNSYVVTIPKAEIERQHLRVGELVTVEIHPLDVFPAMPPEVQAAWEESWRRNQAGYRYLADR
jgi:antitoxin component of MazEF toxin-antitoxin module